MKFRHSAKSGGDGVQMQMTPMIDVVFLLLVFFLAAFRVVAQEGDFNIKMPLARPRDALPDPQQLPPMKVRLRASATGELAGISLNDNSFGSFRDLHNYIIGIVGDDRGPGSIQSTAEVELDCDFNLRYEFVVSAIDAVSGYKTREGEVVRLVEKIRFAPPRLPAGA